MNDVIFVICILFFFGENFFLDFVGKKLFMFIFFFCKWCLYFLCNVMCVCLFLCDYYLWVMCWWDVFVLVVKIC